MTPATTAAGEWTREQETIRSALRDYTQLYGEAWSSAAFNPSVAKWQDRPELVERYYLGNTLRDGASWPSLNTIRKVMGSINAARASVGLEPNRPGPGPGPRRAKGVHAPIRDVRERRTGETFSTGARSGPPKHETVVKTIVDAAEVKRLTRAVATAERRLDRETTKSSKAAARLHDARARARTSATELRRKAEALAAAAAREDELRETAKGLRMELDRLRRELASANAGARGLINDRDGLEFSLAMERARADALDARLAEAQELVTLADEAELARAQTEIEQARGRVAAAVAAQHRAEEAMVAARRDAQAAGRRAAVAERAAAREAALRAEVQRSVTGHDRALTAAELAELRERGPAGEPVFIAAVRGVARARARGGRMELRRALGEVAAAAVRWADRL